MHLGVLCCEVLRGQAGAPGAKYAGPQHLTAHPGNSLLLGMRRLRGHPAMSWGSIESTTAGRNRLLPNRFKRPIRISSRRCSSRPSFRTPAEAYEGVVAKGEKLPARAAIARAPSQRPPHPFRRCPGVAACAKSQSCACSNQIWPYLQKVAPSCTQFLALGKFFCNV